MNPRQVLNAYMKWYHTDEGTSLMTDMSRIWKEPQVPHLLFWMACQDEKALENDRGCESPNYLQHNCYTKNNTFRTKNARFSQKKRVNKKCVSPNKINDETHI